MDKWLVGLFFYLFFCGIYSLIWFKRDKKELVIRVLIPLFFPLIGLIYLLLFDYFIKGQYETNHIDEIENIFTQQLPEGKEMYTKIDLQSEINSVPLEEALLLNDNSKKRKLLMDALRDELLQNPGILKAALTNEDTETSHYAASAVMEMKRKFFISLQEFEVQYEQNKHDSNVLIPYAEVLEKYLSSGFFDERTYQKYQVTYSTVLENLLENHQHEEKYFQQKVNCELVVQNFDKARQYCEKFLICHPQSEIPYLMAMKLFYNLRSFAELHQVLDKLKSSSVRLSNEALQMVRFWSGVGSDNAN